MKKFITEIMDDISEDKTRILGYIQNTTVKAVFQYAYEEEKKFLLPPGSPPYRPAPEPMGMTPTNFLQMVRTWPNFLREDIKPAKREAIFINLLEGIHADEAKLLIAVKEGTLKDLYPWATRAFAEKHGLINKKVKVKKVAKEST